MQTPNQAPTTVPSKELRRNAVLWQHYASAQALLEPLLGNPESHNGTVFYRAMNKLQATFPDLSDSAIEALVAAVVRSVQTRAVAR